MTSIGPTRLAALVLVAAVLAGIFGCGGESPPGALSAADGRDRPQRPNLLILLADDLGYSDPGYLGSEIATPNLNALAERGRLFSRFQVGPTCSPTRAMLLTGTDSHRAGFGSMNGLLSPEQEGQPGYETYLSPDVVTVASLLRDAGYHTYLSGKWHLSQRPTPDLSRLDELDPERVALWRSTLPEARGFERAYYILQGGSSHFDRGGITGEEPLSDFFADGEPVEPPAGFYSSRLFTERLIEMIDADHGDGAPFFALATYTAPHWPLHAPDEYLERYRGVYDEGYDAIRRRRLDRLRELGLLDDATPHPGEAVWASWSELDPRQRAIEARRMEVYAAMVEALDHEIGRLLDHLQEIGELERTFVLFLSDNGADGNNALDLPKTREWVARSHDNSLENMGRPGSFLVQGPGWAQVSSTPFRLYKAFVAEGGITTSAIAALPGRIEPGPSYAGLATVLDVAPTLLELAGVAAPGSSYRGRPVRPIQGRSLLPWLQGRAERVHPPEHAFGLELFNRRMLRRGPWKLLWLNEPWGRDGWELFDVVADPGETKDLFAARPEVAAEMLEAWDRYREENGVILMESFEIGYTNGTSYYDELAAASLRK